MCETHVQFNGSYVLMAVYMPLDEQYPFQVQNIQLLSELNVYPDRVLQKTKKNTCLQCVVYGDSKQSMCLGSHKFKTNVIDFELLLFDETNIYK